MRQLFVAAFAAAALLVCGLNAAHAGKVELTGVHVCCNQCVNLAKTVLGKVEGVSDAVADKARKTVSYTAQYDKDAVACIKALADARYFGAATNDGKELKVDRPTPNAGEKADEVTVKGVHV